MATSCAAAVAGALAPPLDAALAGAFMVGQDGLTTTPGFSVTTSNNGATPGSPNG